MSSTPDQVLQTAKDNSALEDKVAASLVSLRQQLATAVTHGAETPASTQAKTDAIFAEIETATVKSTNALGVVTPPPPPPPPPTGDDAAIQAKYTDSTTAGMNARLGPAGDPAAALPDVWTRPQAPTMDFGFNGGPPPFANFSDGLFLFATPPPVTIPPTPKSNFDFGGTELAVAYVADASFAVNPNNPAALNSDGGPGPRGVGMGRLRTEDHSSGAVQLAPTIPYNDPRAMPDDQEAVVGHTASYGMGNKLGRVIDAVRARINRRDGGFGLYDGIRGGTAYVGTLPTHTAWSPWSGESLDSNFIPLCLAVSSQNEFLYIAGHDKATGTGKVWVIVNWGGGYYTNGALSNFPFDFFHPHPGLVQSGVIVGMKIVGSFDLPIKWPTSISCATSRNTLSNRIEGPDGNAAYLSKYDTSLPGWTDTFDLSTQAGRDAFLAKNGGWIASWGKLVVASKEENKVVQIDATALYLGYRNQYFTTQALYDTTRPTGAITGNYWQFYNTANAGVWPYMLPAWVPTVTRTLDIVRPTQAFMLETNDGAFVVADESGMLRWFKTDGTADGSLQLGPNITSIRDDKYVGGAAIIAVSRVARAVYGIRNKTVSWTIQDKKLVDPVDAEVIDTHGIEERSVSIADFAGKKIDNYRNTKIVFATQGGATFGTGPTAAADKTAADAAVKAGNTPNPPVEGLERTGSFALAGYPHHIAGSNVN